jgi:hypothetical protein
MGLIDYLKEKHEQAPSTQSTAFAYFRTGLKDLQDFVLNLSHDGAKGHDEVGTLGNPPSYEIYKDRQGVDKSTASPQPEQQPTREPETAREPEIG